MRCEHGAGYPEGEVLPGISSSNAYHGALEVAARIKENKYVAMCRINIDVGLVDAGCGAGIGAV